MAKKKNPRRYKDHMKISAVARLLAGEISGTALAAEMGVDNNTVSRWKTVYREPAEALMRKLNAAPPPAPAEPAPKKLASETAAVPPSLDAAIEEIERAGRTLRAVRASIRQVFGGK